MSKHTLEVYVKELGRFALEKAHNPDRLYGLCKAHERIAHCGLIGDEEARPEAWKVQKAADMGAPKYAVDEMVLKYRKAGRRLKARCGRADAAGAWRTRDGRVTDALRAGRGRTVVGVDAGAAVGVGSVCFSCSY
jgi:hypothetical protein